MKPEEQSNTQKKDKMAKLAEGVTEAALTVAEAKANLAEAQISLQQKQREFSIFLNEVFHVPTN